MGLVIEIPIVSQASRRTVALDPPLTDEEFEALCAANRTFQLERTREGLIHVHAPTALNTSDGNSEIIYQLRAWWKKHPSGRVTDSNAGFFLPDGSMLAPDAAYISAGRLNHLSNEDVSRLPHACPDFVIELLSASDSLTVAHAKMEQWVANGVLLGWLLDPYRHTVSIYEPGQGTRIASAGHAAAGTSPVSGFILNLDDVWSCYQ